MKDCVRYLRRVNTAATTRWRPQLRGWPSRPRGRRRAVFASGAGQDQHPVCSCLGTGHLLTERERVQANVTIVYIHTLRALEIVYDEVGQGGRRGFVEALEDPLSDSG